MCSLSVGGRILQVPQPLFSHRSSCLRKLCCIKKNKKGRKKGGREGEKDRAKPIYKKWCFACIEKIVMNSDCSKIHNLSKQTKWYETIVIWSLGDCVCSSELSFIVVPCAPHELTLAIPYPRQTDCNVKNITKKWKYIEIYVLSYAFSWSSWTLIQAWHCSNINAEMWMKGNCAQVKLGSLFW